MKISIIIPVYNEFGTFDRVLERVLQAALPEDCTKEVVVVDDGSTDGTTHRLDNYARDGVVVGHNSILNFGKGTAVRIGIRLASGDVILIQDGDLEYDPNDYSRILQPIVNGAADVVYGSRFIQGRPKGMAPKNLLANRILTITANLLFGAHLTDEATAYKAFRTSVIHRMALKARRFELCPELTAKALRLGFKIVEVPISYNARGVPDGKKIRAWDGFEALWTLIRYRFTPARDLSVPAATPPPKVNEPSLRAGA